MCARVLNSKILSVAFLKNLIMMLEIISLTKKFGGLTALDNVTFSVKEGEILGLIGPNGAGKTTLFNCISGILRPNSGIIRFLGENIVGMKPSQICKKGISRTFQLTRPLFNLTVLQNVLVGKIFGRSKEIPAKSAEDILDFVGLLEKANLYASQLTLVERKKLEIARALSTNPLLLLLDEPAAGLNPTETFELASLVKQIREMGITIVVIEHVMRFIMGIADRIIVLNEGRKIAEGKPQEIAKDENVVKVYLGEKFSM